MSQNPRQSVWRGGYPLWLVSDTAFELTSALVGFVVPLLALMVTDDPALAGIIGGIGLAVRVVSSLVGGVLADRHNRVLLMVLGALVGLLLAAVFTALTVGQWLTFSTLLALNVGFAVRNGLFGAPNQAALKDLVPDSALGRAQAANQGRDAVIGLGGAPLGGLLLGIGAPVVGVAMMLCQAVAAAFASVLSRRVAPFVAPERDPDSRFLRELGDGFRWVFSRPDLQGSLVVSTLVNLGFNASIITIIYSLQQGGASPATIGLVSGGLGVGMLVGAALAPLLVPRVPAGWLGIGGLALITAATAVLPLVERPFGVALVMAVGIMGAPALNAALLGYFMVATPSHLIGRATSALSVFAMGAMPLAPLFAGFGLNLVGRGWTLLGSAAITLAAAMLAILTPSLRSIPAEAGWVEHAKAHERAASPAMADA